VIHYTPSEGELVRAFHPLRLGVVNTGKVVRVGRKYAWIDFGPLLGDTLPVPLKDVLEAA
jgi:hypothetical protein